MFKKLLAGIFAAAVWLAAMFTIPGGALWALTPMGISLAEARLPSGPDGFWQLFASAPLLLAVGVAGLHLRRLTGSGGWLRRVASLVALAGFLMVAAGNVGQFWLGVDDTFIIAAPAYHAFRIGLFVAAAGMLLVGVSALKDRAVPSWTIPPFLIGALGGFVAFAAELGSTGATLWALFGLSWVWLGVVVFFQDVLGLALGRFGKPAAKASAEAPAEKGA